MKRLTAVAVRPALPVVPLILLLAGCGTQDSGADVAAGADTESTTGAVPEGGAMDGTTTASEYDLAAADLSLPEGVSWRGYRIEEGVVSEPGVGLGTAHWEWLCAWQAEWVDAHGRGPEPAEPERANDALDHLRAAPELAVFTEYSDEGTRQAYAEMLRRAEAGDPEGMRRDIDVNCAPAEPVG
ncbi:hypothetical protein GCM10027160_33560 [Streptomyces calidiresistens]|uniref:Lipoprotein n=1 Tax=Streptomyces calidiresistens TaxID=1485586 RepID=A0A7W3XZ19_9ACTN|nr:hypothetical protein [Streptomyces calidiresistens]MBB0232790.1 hypothetical protein [Streptomyces calidiresistens]